MRTEIWICKDSRSRDFGGYGTGSTKSECDPKIDLHILSLDQNCNFELPNPLIILKYHSNLKEYIYICCDIVTKMINGRVLLLNG